MKKTLTRLWIAMWLVLAFACQARAADSWFFILTHCAPTGFGGCSVSQVQVTGFDTAPACLATRDALVPQTDDEKRYKATKTDRDSATCCFDTATGEQDCGQ